MELLGVCLFQHRSTNWSALVFYIRQIKLVRRCLPANAAKSLVHSFVVSRLDYCNSLYADFSRANLDKIQSIFNGAVRLMFGASRFSHVPPLLRDRLHWLRCPERISYKLCVTVFKALYGIAPGYIADLSLPEVISEGRSLRSASTGVRLAMPRR